MDILDIKESKSVLESTPEKCPKCAKRKQKKLLLKETIVFLESKLAKYEKGHLDTDQENPVVKLEDSHSFEIEIEHSKSQWNFFRAVKEYFLKFRGENFRETPPSPRPTIRDIFLSFLGSFIGIAILGIVCFSSLPILLF